MVAQKNGISAKGLQKILGLGSYQTSWTWLHKFRRLMVLSGSAKLARTFGVNEVMVGGKTFGKRGRGTEGKSLIAVEVKGRKTERTRLAKISDASSDSLNEFIENNIEQSSTIITDRWPSYNNLTNIGYGHKIQSQ